MEFLRQPEQGPGHRYLRRWANDQSLSLHATHELQNVIRSFFINNGARVLTKPYPDVYGSKKS
jgi:hypothetical protein